MSATFVKTGIKKNRVQFAIAVANATESAADVVVHLPHDLGAKVHSVALVDGNVATTAGESTSYGPVLYSVNKDVNTDIVTFPKVAAHTTFVATLMLAVEKAGSLTK